MQKLTAKNDTYIKKSTEQSSKLPSTEKKLYNTGETIDVEKAESSANGHLKVTLDSGAGVWYIYRPDWSDFDMASNVDGDSEIHRQAIDIVTEFEGFVPRVYDDGVGVATIGIGTTRYPDGRSVRFGDSNIDLATAEKYLTHDLAAVVKQLKLEIPHWDVMNDNQQSALISFGYNLGEYFYANPGFNTITAVLRGKRWNDLPKTLELYSMPGTGVHAGLLRRRKAEGELWQGKGKFAV